MQAVKFIFPWFPDIDGTALDNGSIFIGKPNLNPELDQNQLPVFADAAGTIPLSQPIKTMSGLPSNAGSPVNIFVEGDYAITVRNKSNTFIYGAPTNVEVTVPSGGTGSGNIVDDFGAIPNDPTVDNAPIFQEVFNSGSGRIFVPPGQFNIDELLLIDIENLELIGVPGATTIVSSTLTELAQIIRMSNAKIYGITFLSTYAIGTPARGVVFGDSPELYVASFEKCFFTNGGQNKAGGLVVLGTGTFTQFQVLDCFSAGVGGKGFSFDSDSANLCNINNNTVYGSGQYAGEDGTGLEFTSNNGNNNDILFNSVIAPTITGMRLAGLSYSLIQGNSFTLGDADVLVTSDGRGRMVGNKYLFNRVGGRPLNSGVTIKAHDNPIFQGNTWFLSKPFEVIDTIGLKGSGELIDSDNQNAVIVSGVSSNNEWIGGKITNAEATPNVLDVTVVNTGPDALSTRLVSVEIYKEPTLGSLVAGLLSAPPPQPISCSGDASGGGGNVTTGVKTSTGILVAGVVGVDAVIQVILDPTSATDYSPYVVDVTISSISHDSPDGAMTEDKRAVKARNSPSANSCELTEGGFSSVIDPDVSGPGFQIRGVYPATAPDEVIDYAFDISITGPGVPTFTVLP